MVPKRYLPIFILLASCFALWGLLNNMTDNLVPSFQKIFMPFPLRQVFFSDIFRPSAVMFRYNRI